MSRRAQLQETVWRIDPHTTIKHLVYKHYIACWMGKVLQRYRRAAIVDGFAGPGEYEGGVDGSPVIVARLFEDHKLRQRFGHLDLIAQEGRSDRVAHLRNRMRTFQADPRLHPDVRDAAQFADELDALDDLAHGGDKNKPVLWLIDPFSWEPAPATVIDRCLNGSHDEVIFTLFVDEVYRFLNSESHEAAISRYFGDSSWMKLRDLPKAEGERACKQALIDLYCRQLQTRNHGTYTGHFSVTVKNQTPRYALIFATHEKAGLSCWAPVTWRLDQHAGQIHTTKPEQLDLFTVDLSPAEKLADELKRFAGRQVPWLELTDLTLRLNYLERHLRAALDLLGDEGLALRITPLRSQTPWPAGSVVQFYSPEDVAAG